MSSNLARRAIFLLALISVLSNLKGQGPAYVNLGREALVETDIYSIGQDDEGLIWLTTDNGLLRYDGYEFAPIPTVDPGSRSLFGLTKGKQGELYCFDLGGKIYRIVGDSVSLHYQIPDSLLINQLSISVAPDSSLWVSCRQVIRLRDGKAEIWDGDDLSSQGRALHWDPQGNLYLPGGEDAALYRIRNGKVRDRLNLPTPDTSYLAIHSELFRHQDQLYYLQQEETRLFRVSQAGLAEISLDRRNLPARTFSSRVMVTHDGQYWFSAREGGCYVFDQEGTPLYGGNKVLAEHSIAGFLEDHEHNLWITTLGDGILFIPDKQTISFSRTPGLKDKRIRKVTTDHRGHVYLNTRDNEIIQLGPSLQIQPSPYRANIPFTVFDYLPEQQVMAYNSLHGLLLVNDQGQLELDLNIGASKGIQGIDPKTVLITTSSAIHLNTVDGSHVPVEFTFLGGTQPQPNRIIWPQSVRTYSGYYDDSVKQLWVGTVKGLKVIDANGEREVTWKGEPIFAQAFCEVEDGAWICTSNLGIIRIRNGHFSDQISESEDLGSNSVSKVIQQDQMLFIQHAKGLQLYDLSQKTLHKVGMKDGLPNNIIADFSVQGDNLWVVANGQLHQLNIPTLARGRDIPRIRLTSLRVNDQTRSLSEVGSFSSGERRFEFEFKALGYRHLGTLKYRYKLEGDLDAWQEADFEEHRIRYPSLGPGDYVFRVKAVNENGWESEEVSYGFSIARPFWQTPLFFILCLAVLALLLISYFLLRIRRIEQLNTRKAEQERIEKELMASRLEALTAQMNPHFMFNSLNSIQEHIVSGEPRLARKYLGKFAHLMRIYLSHSRSRKVSIREEVDALTTYLELEKLRFEDTLDYEIKVGPELQEGPVDIPSMLIQPFVENAVIHGLLHKEKDRHLRVTFYQAGFEDGIVVVIEDNGVGRERAAQIRKMRNPSHQSLATASTKRRLDLLNHGRQDPIGLNIEDLFDEAGQARGTRITLTIPAI